MKGDNKMKGAQPKKDRFAYFEQGKTGISAGWVFAGMVVILGGLQNEGILKILTLPGFVMIGAVVYDTLIRKRKCR